MLIYLLRRLLELLLVLFGVSVLVFGMIRLIPGDAVLILLGANTEITPERVLALRHQLGLDLPAPVQYWRWLGGVLRGDLGRSVWTERPVVEEIRARLPATLELTCLALLLGVGVAIPLGVATASSRRRWADYLTRLLAMLGLSTPTFWSGTLFILLLAHLAPGYPAIGYVALSTDPVGSVLRLLLPAFTLSLPLAAGLSRLVRSTVLEVLGQDFVRTARAKGLSERVVLYRHGLRNALIPVVTILGVQTGYLFGGAIVIEEVFAIPGVGRLVLGAINQRNYPLVQGVVLLITAVFVLINLVVDLGYTLLDPRVRQ